jgi:UDP-N-acetyl-D-glucosamine dehydrogenase
VIITDHAIVDYQRVADLAPRIFDTRNATRSVVAGRQKIRKL